MATATAAPATACCPTCGSAARVVDGLLVPILTGAQVDAAERIVRAIRNDDWPSFWLATRDFSDAGTGNPTPLVQL